MCFTAAAAQYLVDLLSQGMYISMCACVPGRHTSVCVLYDRDHNRQVRLRGRLGPFVSRVSWCCPIMVSSLLALLSLLVTHALHSRVELPPCQVPQTGLR